MAVTENWRESLAGTAVGSMVFVARLGATPSKVRWCEEELTFRGRLNRISLRCTGMGFLGVEALDFRFIARGQVVCGLGRPDLLAREAEVRVVLGSPGDGFPAAATECWMHLLVGVL